MASHGIIRRSTDLESSTQVTSDAVLLRNIPHHVHVDGINGSAELHQLLTYANVLWHVTLSKV